MKLSFDTIIVDTGNVGTGKGKLMGCAGAIFQSCANFPWARTEMATVWSGNTGGAIQSGQRTATKVLEA